MVEGWSDNAVQRKIVFPDGKGVKVIPPSSVNGSDRTKDWKPQLVRGRVKPGSETEPTICVLTSEDFILGGTYEDLEVFFSTLLDALYELRVVEMQQNDGV